jgi:hypothetical protein
LAAEFQAGRTLSFFINLVKYFFANFHSLDEFLIDSA